MKRSPSLWRYLLQVLWIACLLWSSNPHADTPPTSSWLFRGGGPNPDAALALAADSTGTTYVAGCFGIAAQFGSQVLNPTVGYDLLLMRLDPAGNVVWAKDVEPGAPELLPFRLKLDPQGKLVLMAGIPGDGESGGPLHMLLLAKYDTNGTPIWTRKIKTGFLGTVVGGDLAVDAGGNLYVSGAFSGTADFGGITATSKGGADIFAAKFSSSGVPLAVRSYGQSGALDDVSYGLALDATGNVFVAAQFGGTVQFGATTLTSAGGTDLAILRFDSGLNLLGARRYGTEGDETAAAMTSDAAGNVYLLGSVSQQLLLGPSLLSPAISGTYFAARLDATGGVVWATLVGPGDYGGYIGTLSGSQGFVTDSAGSLLISGRGYLGKLSRAGTLLWRLQLPAAQFNAVAVTSLTNVYVAGRFDGTITLGGLTANSAGAADVLVARMALAPLLAPVVNVPPAPVAAFVGGNAVFSVGVSGTAPFYYQWRKNGTDMPGQIGSSLTLTGVGLDATGDYSVVVGNSAGTVTSPAAHLAVSVAAPKITIDPVPRSVLVGATVTFSVTATGVGPLTYQWWHGTKIIANATASSYTITGVTAADAGDYSVVVSNAGGSTPSKSAALVVQYVAPAIVTPPASLTVLAGTNAAFSVVASGSAPLTYEWRFKGNPLAGAVTPQLVISNVTLAHAGDYAVVVRNPGGSATSTVARLTVHLPPLPAPEWQWVSGGGGTGTDGQGALLVDAAGNSYVGGYLMGPARFGPLSSSLNILGASLIKLDPTGKALWLNRAAGGGILGMTFDPEGNILAVGSYTLGDMTIGGIKLAAPSPIGNTVMFIAKYTPAGAVLWAKRAPQARPVAIAPDGTGGAIIAGGFQGVAQFDTKLLTNVNFGDVFVARCDGNGNFLWARSGQARDLTSSNPNASALGGMDVDSTGKIWVAGRFAQTLSFGGPPLTNRYSVVASQAGYQMFVARLGMDGSLLWQTNSTNAAAVGFATVSVLEGTNALVAGFNGAGALSWGSQALAGTNTFVGRVEGNGKFDWLLAGKLPLLRPGLQLATGSDGGAYLLTAVTGDVELGDRIIPAGGTGLQRTFLARIEPGGAWGWGRVDGTVGVSTLPGSITLDSTGTPLAAGWYTGAKTTIGAFTVTNYPSITTAEMWVGRLVQQVSEAPAQLSMSFMPGGVRLAWPLAESSWKVESTTALGAGFTPLNTVLQTNLAEGVVYTVIAPGPNQRFFRLQKF